MKIKIFLRKLPHQYRYGAAFAQGLRRHGVACEIGSVDSYSGCDVAVIWGHNAANVIEGQRSLGRHYLVMEAGYVANPGRLDWCSLGWDGLNGRADFCNANATSDRWDRLFAEELKPWRTPSGYALILGQCRGDAATRGVNLEVLYQQATVDLGARGYAVRYRPHPLGFGVRGLQEATGSLYDALNGAALAVTWSSNSATEATLYGVPCVTYDEGAMAYPVAAHSVEDAPHYGDRLEWAWRLAWAQWSEIEIERGDAWAHLSEKLA